MISSFYTGRTGLMAMQSGLDVVSNNVANANTEGFKSARPVFTELIQKNLHDTAEANSPLRAGVGSKLGATNVLYGEGSRESTTRAMDLAIDNSRGFFAVQSAGGVLYTRAGDFQKRVQKDGSYLLTDALGNSVLDAKGQPVKLPKEGTVIKPPANSNQEETVITGDEKPNVGVFTFENQDGLQQVGGGYFAATEASGAAKADTKIEVSQGVLERSNSDSAQNMSDLIQLQRSFQFNSRIVQMSDEIMQTINQLR